MHLAVMPSQRGRGFGAWLMFETQKWASDHGYTQIQASVQAAHSRLLRYYQRLGARIVPTGIGSGDSAAPTVVRIARDFNRDVAEREVEASRRRGGGRRERSASFRLSHGTKRAKIRIRQLARTVTRTVFFKGGGKNAALVVVAAAAAAVVSVRWMTSSARRR